MWMVGSARSSMALMGGRAACTDRCAVRLAVKVAEMMIVKSHQVATASRPDTEIGYWSPPATTRVQRQSRVMNSIAFKRWVYKRKNRGANANDYLRNCGLQNSAYSSEGFRY